MGKANESAAIDRTPSRQEEESKEDDGDESEEEECPDEFAQEKFKTIEEQQAAIKRSAAYLCGVGTVVVLIFSDPISDVLTAIGERIGVNAFYVAFVVAPLITNLGTDGVVHLRAEEDDEEHDCGLRATLRCGGHEQHVLLVHLPHPHRGAGPVLELYGRGHRYTISGALRFCGGHAIQGPHDEDGFGSAGHLPRDDSGGVDARDARGHLLIFPLFL